MANERLEFDFVADTSSLDRGVRRAEGSLGGLQKTAVRAGAALAGIFVVREFAQQASQYVRQLDRAAQAANAARVEANLFSKTLTTNSQSIVAGRRAVEQLSDQFRTLPDQVQSAATILVRAGADVDQIVPLLEAGGASALAFGRDAQDGFQNVAQAVATGRSELLESIGIVANLGPVYQDFAEDLGKTREELTQQEKIQAGINAILAETRQEVASVDEVVDSYAGTVSAANNAGERFRRELGEFFTPALVRAREGFTDAANAAADFLARLNRKPVDDVKEALQEIEGGISGPTGVRQAFSLLSDQLEGEAREAFEFFARDALTSIENVSEGIGVLLGRFALVDLQSEISEFQAFFDVTENASGSVGEFARITGVRFQQALDALARGDLDAAVSAIQDVRDNLEQGGPPGAGGFLRDQLSDAEELLTALEEIAAQAERLSTPISTGGGDGGGGAGDGAGGAGGGAGGDDERGAFFRRGSAVRGGFGIQGGLSPSRDVGAVVIDFLESTTGAISEDLSRSRANARAAAGELGQQVVAVLGQLSGDGGISEDLSPAVAEARAAAGREAQQISAVLDELDEGPISNELRRSVGASRAAAGREAIQIGAVLGQLEGSGGISENLSDGVAEARAAAGRESQQIQAVIAQLDGSNGDGVSEDLSVGVALARERAGREAMRIAAVIGQLGGSGGISENLADGIAEGRAAAGLPGPADQGRSGTVGRQGAAPNTELSTGAQVAAQAFLRKLLDLLAGEQAAAETASERFALGVSRLADVALSAAESVPVLGSAITGFVQAGPMGALAGVVQDLIGPLLENKAVQEALSKISNALANALEPLAPILAKLLEALTPIIAIAAQLLGALAPIVGFIVDILTPVIEFLAGVIRAVANGVIGIINALIAVINLIPGVNIAYLDFLEEPDTTPPEGEDDDGDDEFDRIDANPVTFPRPEPPGPEFEPRLPRPNGPAIALGVERSSAQPVISTASLSAARTLQTAADTMLEAASVLLTAVQSDNFQAANVAR